MFPRVWGSLNRQSQVTHDDQRYRVQLPSALPVIHESLCIELFRESDELFLSQLFLLLSQQSSFVLLGTLPEARAQGFQRLLLLLRGHCARGVAVEVKPRFAIRERLQVARRSGMHPHCQTKLLRIDAGNPFQYGLVNADRKGTALLKYWKRRSQ